MGEPVFLLWFRIRVFGSFLLISIIFPTETVTEITNAFSNLAGDFTDSPGTEKQEDDHQDDD